MRWIEASVETHSGDIDEKCEKLAELGVPGMVIEDEADFRAFLENNRQYWDYVDDELERHFAGVSRIKFYLSDDADGLEVLRRVRITYGIYRKLGMSRLYWFHRLALETAKYILG